MSFFKGEKVLTVQAIDPDLDAQLEYTIAEVRAADKTGVALRDTNIYDYKHAFRSVVLNTKHLEKRCQHLRKGNSWMTCIYSFFNR